MFRRHGRLLRRKTQGVPTATQMRIVRSAREANSPFAVAPGMRPLYAATPMGGALLHTAFDALAWLAAGLSLFWLVRSTDVRFPSAPTRSLPYLAVLVFG